MAKPQISRGLPADFGLNVDTNSPVVLGDFLDENFGHVSVPPKIPQRTEFEKPVAIEKVVDLPVPAEREIEVPLQHQEADFKLETVSEHSRTLPEISPPAPLKSKAVRRPSRKEICIDSDTIKRLQEIVDEVRKTSPESDTRASEVVEAIIHLVYEARGFYEFSRVPRRGRWGSITEKQFPAALSAAFERALADWLRVKG